MRLCWRVPSSSFLLREHGDAGGGHRYIVARQGGLYLPQPHPKGVRRVTDPRPDVTRWKNDELDEITSPLTK